MNSVDIQECIIIIFSKSSRRYGIFQLMVVKLCMSVWIADILHAIR